MTLFSAAVGVVLMLSACAFDLCGADDSLVVKQMTLAIWCLLSSCFFKLIEKG